MHFEELCNILRCRPACRMVLDDLYRPQKIWTEIYITSMLLLLLFKIFYDVCDCLCVFLVRLLVLLHSTSGSCSTCQINWVNYQVWVDKVLKTQQSESESVEVGAGALHLSHEQKPKHRSRQTKIPGRSPSILRGPAQGSFQKHRSAEHVKEEDV